MLSDGQVGRLGKNKKQTTGRTGPAGGKQHYRPEFSQASFGTIPTKKIICTGAPGLGLSTAKKGIKQVTEGFKAVLID
jgi:hypothetical protein